MREKSTKAGLTSKGADQAPPTMVATLVPASLRRKARQGAVIGIAVVRIALLMGASLIAGVGRAERIQGAFDLARLPRGKSVTIPRPATTYVGVGETARFVPTDMPQALSLMAINPSGGKLSAIKVSIFDRHSEKVTYAEIKPGMPFIYTFRALDPITVKSEKMGGAGLDAAHLKLKIESDKPLEIGR